MSQHKDQPLLHESDTNKSQVFKITLPNGITATTDLDNILNDSKDKSYIQEITVGKWSCVSFKYGEAKYLPEVETKIQSILSKSGTATEKGKVMWLIVGKVTKPGHDAGEKFFTRLYHKVPLTNYDMAILHYNIVYLNDKDKQSIKYVNGNIVLITPAIISKLEALYQLQWVMTSDQFIKWAKNPIHQKDQEQLVAMDGLCCSRNHDNEYITDVITANLSMIYNQHICPMNTSIIKTLEAIHSLCNKSQDTLEDFLYKVSDVKYIMAIHNAGSIKYKRSWSSNDNWHNCIIWAITNRWIHTLLFDNSSSIKPPKDKHLIKMSLQDCITKSYMILMKCEAPAV